MHRENQWDEVFFVEDDREEHPEILRDYTRQGLLMRLFIGIVSVCCLALGACEALPAPIITAKTPAILFLGSDAQIDPLYAKDLHDAGYAYLTHDICQPLTYDFMRQFTVIVLDQFPWYGSQYHVLGQKTRFFLANMHLVWRFAEDGGGVLVYTNLTDGGGARARQWNTQMRPWDIQLVQACLRDPATAFGKFTVYGPNYYCWTEAITPHPVTAGVKRVYYPSVNARFDDNYTAVPLQCSSAWTPLVQGMPTSRVVIEVDRKEVDLPEHQCNIGTGYVLIPFGNTRAPTGTALSGRYQYYGPRVSSCAE